jgi:hypothetical protein
MMAFGIVSAAAPSGYAIRELINNVYGDTDNWGTLRLVF